MNLFALSLAAISSTSKDVVSKKLSFKIDGALSAFTSFLFALPYYTLLLLIGWCCGLEFFYISRSFFWLIIARSVTDGMGEYSKMQAFKYGDLSLVSPLLSLSPIVLLLLSPIITGDPLTLTGVISVALAVSGTYVLMKRPSHESKLDNRAVFYSIATSLFFALNNCFDRLLVLQSTPIFSGFSMTLMTAAILSPTLLRDRTRLLNIKQCLSMLSLRGLFEVLYMVGKLSALQTMQAPYVSAFLRVSVLFSIIGGKVMFDERNFIRRLCAGILILGGILVVFLES